MQTIRTSIQDRPRLAFAAVGAMNQRGIQRYMLRSLWAIHYYEYEADFRLGDLKFRLIPGCITLTPPRTVSEYDFPPVARHHCAHFALTPTGGRPPALLPLFTPPGPVCEKVRRLLDESNSLYPSEPLRAEIKLWDALWELASTTRSHLPQNAHPALKPALALIRKNLFSPLTLPQIARESELSTVHLNRLFQRHLGESVMSYARRLRLDQARHLLIHSTKPIKVIAAEVGVTDLHAFNKLIKKHFGKSPRQLRG